MTKHLAVAVVDTAPLATTPPSAAEPPELRVSTLTPSSLRFLQSSGAWPHMAPHAAAFDRMQVPRPRAHCLLPFSLVFSPL